MASKPAGWVTKALKEARGPIDRWLRTFVPDEPELYPLGGGHFGFAYAIIKPGWGTEGPPARDRLKEYSTGLVFKITRDPTEGPFCRWIQEEQEKGNSLFQGAFARMYDVRRLSGTISWRGKEWPRFLIVREEVVPCSGVWGAYMERKPGFPVIEVAEATALRTLQIAARQIVKPRKRGRATVTEGVHRGGVYLGHRAVDAEKAWEDALGVLERNQEFYYTWEAFWQLRSEYDLYLQDVHWGNIGRRLKMPGEDWSGAEGYWVIFDPGHTPTNQGLPIEDLEARAGNPRGGRGPCHGVKVPVLR